MIGEWGWMGMNGDEWCRYAHSQFTDDNPLHVGSSWDSLCSFSPPAPYPVTNHQLLYLWPEPRTKTGAASVSQQLGLLLQQVNFRDSRQENMGKLVQRLFNQFQHSLYLKASSWWGKRLQSLDFVQSCQPAVSIGWSGIRLEHVGWKYVCEPRTNKTRKVRGMRPFILSFSKGSHLHSHPTRRAPHHVHLEASVQASAISA